MPGADDVGLILGEGQTHAGLVIRDQLLHAGDDLALTHRSSHVRTDVFKGSEFAVSAKHANFRALDLYHLAARIREGGRLANYDILHGAHLGMLSRAAAPHRQVEPG